MGIGKSKQVNVADTAPAGYLAETAGNITYFVRADGNDSNTGLSADDALLTIQAAIVKIPKVLCHKVLVDIGPGTFDGLVVSGFLRGSVGGQLLIEGKLGNATLVSGSFSGTATDGTTSTLIDSTQSWTANDLRGKYLLIGGTYRLCRTNSATEIETVGTFPFSCASQPYTIVEHKTVIDTPYGSYDDVVFLTVNRGSKINFPASEGLIHLKDLKAAPSSAGGFSLMYTDGISMTRCGYQGIYPSGVFFQSVRNIFGICDCFATGINDSNYLTGIEFFKCFEMLHGITRIHVFNNTVSSPADDNAGIWVHLCDDITGSFWYSDDNGNANGVYLGYSTEEDIDGIFCDGNGLSGVLQEGGMGGTSLSNMELTNNSQHGLWSRGSAAASFYSVAASGNGGYGLCFGNSDTSSWLSNGATRYVNDALVESNALGGINLATSVVLELSNCDGYNSGYGLIVGDRCTVYVYENIELSGYSGDLTLNGSTTLGWAEDFSASGDSAVNTNTASRVERKS